MKFLNIKNKLLFLSIVPILLTLILFAFIVSSSLDEKKSLMHTKSFVIESNAISKVIHFMQIERGLSVGYIAKNNFDKKDEKLLTIKQNLNEAIDSAKKIYVNINYSKYQKILKILSDIQTSREKFDLKTNSVLEVKEFYTQKIDSLLDYITVIPITMDDRQNRNSIHSFVYLSNAVEKIGVIRATLNVVFVEGEISKTDYVTVKGLLKDYHRNIYIFKNTLSEGYLQHFEKILKSKAIKDTFDIIELTFNEHNNNKNFSTKSDDWFEKSTLSINILNLEASSMFDNMLKHISKKLEYIFYKLIIILFFSIMGLIALMSVVVSFSKKILTSTNKLSEDYMSSLSLLEQYKSSVDRSFVVSKTDKMGIITYVNDEFCRVSGYTREELLGKPHNIIRDPSVDSSVFKELWHTIKNKKEPWFGDIVNQAKDGSSFWTKAIINPILNSNGEVMEYIGIRTDITELEKARVAALSAEKAKSAFLATMSHELRTPLNSVIGFSQILIAKNDASQEATKSFIEKINISGKHLLNLVNNILDFSKIESGKMELNKVEIILDDFINDTVLLVENEALKKEIQIIKEGFDNISLSGDKQLLKQVVLNILSNAIKFSNKNSNIKIIYKKDEQNNIISICDEGVGLSQEQLDKLFKPFSQIQEHQNNTAKGTGLGLIISRKILELHNGDIKVQSEKNKGSCFDIYLPNIKG
jgi:PAS domain S-box-containing protein